MLKRIIAMLAMLASLVLPTSALAAIWHANMRWEPPSQPHSLQPERPIAQQGPALRALGLTYNSSLGTVTITWGYYEPAYWQAHFQGPGCNEPLGENDTGEYRCIPPEPLDFILAPTCAEAEGIGPDGYGWVPATGAEFSGEVVSNGIKPGGRPGEGNEVQLSGYNGRIKAEATFDGTNYTVIFRSDAFVRRNPRCLTLKEWTGPETVTVPLRSNIKHKAHRKRRH